MQRYSIMAVVLMVCLTVVYLNFQHTNGCSSGGDEDVKMYIEALNKRLLKAESENIQNKLLLDKFIEKVQSKIIHLEKLELKELQESAIGEAVRVTLRLAQQPLPVMPVYDVSSAFKSAEELADAIDDIFERVSSGKDTAGGGSTGGIGEKSGLDTTYGAEETQLSEEKPIMSDKAATKKCTHWKEKFGVVVGVSWGNAPVDIQEKWIQLSCDYHLVGGASAEEQEEEYFELANELVDRGEEADAGEEVEGEESENEGI